MSVQEQYVEELKPIINDYLETLEEDNIREYLAKNSNLPGQRANLELANALADITLKYRGEQADMLWAFYSHIVRMPLKFAKINTPREFLPLCGVYGLGAIASKYPSYLTEALGFMKKAAVDQRWRVREAVAQNLTKLISVNSRKTMDIIFPWIYEKEYFLTRAVAEGFSDPELMKNPKIAKRALELHFEIIGKFVKIRERKSFEFKTMMKGLGHTLSIVVAASPEKGFEFMESLTLIDDRDVIWILKQTLRKNRLKNRFPEQVAFIKAQLLG